MSKVPYSSVDGCLIYAMVLIRSDISHVVSAISRLRLILAKSIEGCQEHWRVVKWIFRYLRGTSSYSLVYEGERKNDKLVVGYVISDYTKDLDNRRSFASYLFTIKIALSVEKKHCKVLWPCQ